MSQDTSMCAAYTYNAHTALFKAFLGSPEVLRCTRFFGTRGSTKDECALLSWTSGMPRGLTNGDRLRSLSHPMGVTYPKREDGAFEVRGGPGPPR